MFKPKRCQQMKETAFIQAIQRNAGERPFPPPNLCQNATIQQGKPGGSASSPSESRTG
ncbi:MAG: hypothetical protein H6654_15145 [Ardenticatenaceae bacterium]|nr:hypothetical protein [Anaerolineales bacterium]MCB8939682.1 hypothetical protein [Ardenticatenaceae bacterium]MCB8974893.1 hypothetical protein [Ardenticatenaceae bacterium]